MNPDWYSLKQLIVSAAWGGCSVAIQKTNITFDELLAKFN